MSTDLDETDFESLPVFGATCSWPLERLASAEPGSPDGDSLAAALTRYGLLVFGPLDKDPPPQLWREAYVTAARSMRLSISTEHEPQPPRSAGNSLL